MQTIASRESFSSPTSAQNECPPLPPSDLRQGTQIKKQKWQLLRVFFLLLLDLEFSSSLYITYKRSKTETDDQPVFFWILILSLFRIVVIVIGGFMAVFVGLPSIEDVTQEVRRQEELRLQYNDVISDSTLSRPSGKKKSHLLRFFQFQKVNPRNGVGPSSLKGRPTETTITKIKTESTNLLTPFLSPRKDNAQKPGVYAPSHQNVESSSSCYQPPPLISSPGNNEGGLECDPSCISPQTPRRKESDDSMTDILGFFGTEAARKIESETRYHRAVKRVAKVTHLRRNCILVAIFLGLSLSNFIGCIWFVNVSSELEHLFGYGPFLY